MTKRRPDLAACPVDAELPRAVMRAEFTAAMAVLSEHLKRLAERQAARQQRQTEQLAEIAKRLDEAASVDTRSLTAPDGQGRGPDWRQHC